MKRFQLSSAPQSIYLLLGSDPNTSNHEFVLLQGIDSSEIDLEVSIQDDRLQTVFNKLYANLRVSSISLLEYFTYLPAGKYILSIRANKTEVKTNILFW